ncbi:late blight resistance protein R1-A-like [Apium graveolens]|uniref:late blight resistance protein R1-A-like n=1 Tax=Apium graveolens TaxID=4045 RepID=UPI003D7A871B
MSIIDKKLSQAAMRIYYYKDHLMRTTVGLENHNDPVDLNSVGDQLVLEVAAIYEASLQLFGKTEECVSQDFASYFYFDKKKFQEQLDEEVFVGFQEEASNLLKKLACITKKKLEAISIVGMAGLGKTTLARRLYNDLYLVSYFYVRVWVCCSQDYQKRDLLLGILRSVVEITDEVCRMNDNMLEHVLYRALMGRRYLIVIDDMWSCKAWDDLKRCFPDNNNGSKIMLTTQLNDVALHAQSDGNPFCLRFLTEEESFDLFRRKPFITGNLFEYLSLTGKSITKKCHGLPLAIVVIAGLLKNNLKMDWWLKVEESVSSYIVIDKNQYMDTLALSYNHLPTHLRPCFLYFGAFPEDNDIPVSKLLRLWIAEGFICQDGTGKRLENVAMDYLMDLMSRSLVVGTKGSNGAIKTCRIHDLLHDLCLRKSQEENCSPNTFCNKHSYICPHSSANPSKKSQLMLNTNVLTIPSNCSCYSTEVSYSFFKDVAILGNLSGLTRALDISSIEFFVFPIELLQLVHLRYLELRFRSGNPPDSISQLTELQTLIMTSRVSMVVPENMWKIIQLRHLRIKSGENLVKFYDVEEPSLLENLQTMSLVF